MEQQQHIHVSSPLSLSSLCLPRSARLSIARDVRCQRFRGAAMAFVGLIGNFVRSLRTFHFHFHRPSCSCCCCCCSCCCCCTLAVVDLYNARRCWHDLRQFLARQKHEALYQFLLRRRLIHMPLRQQKEDGYGHQGTCAVGGEGSRG